MEEAPMESLTASLLIIHSCLIPKPAQRFMPTGSGIRGAVRWTEGTLPQKRGEGGYSVGMLGRTGSRKLTSLLKEGITAGEQRRGLNATTQSFATTPPWVRKNFLVEDYFIICLYLVACSTVFSVKLNNPVMCVKWRLFAKRQNPFSPALLCWYEMMLCLSREFPATHCTGQGV